MTKQKSVDKVDNENFCKRIYENVHEFQTLVIRPIQSQIIQILMTKSVKY